MTLSSAIINSSNLNRASSLWQTAAKQETITPRVQSTGLRELDELLNGGLPLGKITEVTGMIPSGKTSLVLTLLSEATRAGKLSAYIDTFSSLDPEYAGQAGIALEYLLWVRCKDPEGKGNRGTLYEKAFKAADILARSGDFGVVVLDMADVPDIRTRRRTDSPEPPAPRSFLTSKAPAKEVSEGGWQRTASRNFPLHAWFRLQRALKGSSTAFVVLSPQSNTGRAASIVLSLECSRSRWVTAHSPLGITGRFPSLAIGNQFQGIESEAHLLRGRAHGSITVYCRL